MAVQHRSGRAPRDRGTPRGIGFAVTTAHVARLAGLGALALGMAATEAPPPSEDRFAAHSKCTAAPDHGALDALQERDCAALRAEVELASLGAPPEGVAAPGAEARVAAAPSPR